MAACGCYAAPAERGRRNARCSRHRPHNDLGMRRLIGVRGGRWSATLTGSSRTVRPFRSARRINSVSKMSPPKLTGLHERQQARSLDGLDAVGVAHVQPEAVPEQHREHRGHDPAPDAPLIV